jgi:16S rRNA (cytosine967-C5)-methyltransferase
MARRVPVTHPRALAAQVLARVMAGRYLDDALDEALAARPPEAALVQELAYGTLRWFHQLAGIAKLFLDKPLKPKDQDIYALLLAGLYQLRALRVATHAAVDETVAAAGALGKPWVKGLINACLREYLRRASEADDVVKNDATLRLSHPDWLLEKFRTAWPDDGERIATANNERPPLVLRVNLRKTTRTQYLEALHAAGLAPRPDTLLDTDITLETPVPVTQLPGFAGGQVSVQDAAAQWAAVLLDAQPGHRVLDACAAPGGKTGHILERTPDLAACVAVDREAARVARIDENLERLGLTARLVTADAADPAEWWDSKPFDRILLDAPCSATGVIRRHPDVKLRRKPADLPKLAAAQARLLSALWPLLQPGGKLLYVTCSILPEENENTVRAFLAREATAVDEPLPEAVGRPCAIGRQILPGERGMDGFYYACLRKK